MLHSFFLKKQNFLCFYNHPLFLLLQRAATPSPSLPPFRYLPDAAAPEFECKPAGGADCTGDAMGFLLLFFLFVILLLYQLLYVSFSLNMN